MHAVCARRRKSALTEHELSNAHLQKIVMHIFFQWARHFRRFCVRRHIFRLQNYSIDEWNART